jgi:hypothetical protein
MRRASFSKDGMLVSDRNSFCRALEILVCSAKEAAAAQTRIEVVRVHVDSRFQRFGVVTEAAATSFDDLLEMIVVEAILKKPANSRIRSRFPQQASIVEEKTEFVF